MEGILFQLNFAAVIDTVSHCSLLYNLRSIGVEGLFLSMVSEFLGDKRQRVSLDAKISSSVDVVLGLSQA